MGRVPLPVAGGRSVEMENHQQNLIYQVMQRGKFTIHGRVVGKEEGRVYRRLFHPGKMELLRFHGVFPAGRAGRGDRCQPLCFFSRCLQQILEQGV